MTSQVLFIDDDYNRDAALAFLRQTCKIGNYIGGLAETALAVQKARSKDGFTLPADLDLSHVQVLPHGVHVRTPVDMSLAAVLAREMPYWPQASSSMPTGTTVDFISQRTDGTLDYWGLGVMDNQPMHHAVGSSRKVFSISNDAGFDLTRITRSEWRLQRGIIRRAEEDAAIAAAEQKCLDEGIDLNPGPEAKDGKNEEDSTTIFKQLMDEVEIIRKLDGELQAAHDLYIKVQTNLSALRREAQTRLNAASSNLRFLGVEVKLIDA